MGLFKNEVGRPSNETIKKRNIFKGICFVLVLIIIGLVCYIFKDDIKIFNTGNKTSDGNNKVTTTLNKEEKTNKDTNNKYVITYETEEYSKENIKNTRLIATVKNEANQEAADKIQKTLRETLEENWREIKENTDDFAGKTDEKLGVDIKIKTLKVTDKYLSFDDSIMGSFGGVVWSSVGGLMFDAKTGDKVSLNDISTNSDELNKVIYQFGIDYLNKENHCLMDDWKSNLLTLISNNWNLDDNGFNIYISKYDVACGADGSKIINVPYSKINDYLKDEYKNK